MTTTNAAPVRHFPDPMAGNRPCDRRDLLVTIERQLAVPHILARPVAVSVGGKPCLAERVGPLSWRLSCTDAGGKMIQKFIHTTDPDRVAEEAIRVATDLAAGLRPGLGNVMSLPSE